MEKNIPRQSRYLAISFGILAIIFFFVINIIAEHFFIGHRVDFTDTKRFTLSMGTQKIISDIATPITLRFYFSREMAQKSPALTNYANRIQDMLKEYVNLARGNIVLKIIEPAAFSESEDEALDYGLTGVPVNDEGEELFFGLVASIDADHNMMIPFFQSQREPFLEYDLSQLLFQLVHPKLPVIAAITSLPIEGQLSLLNADVKPWVIWEQISNIFDARLLKSDITQIDDDVDVLMLIQPKNLTQNALMAIDNFVMRGGRILAFLDPYSEVLREKGEFPSSMDPLLKAWGVDYSPDKAVAYRETANSVRYRQDDRDLVDPYPLWMTLDQNHLSQKDMISTQLQNLILATPGFFSKRADSKMQFESIIEISEGAMTVPVDKIEKYQEEPKLLLREYQSEPKHFSMGVRLTGTVNSAFQKGQSSDKANIILIGDSDFLFDSFWVQVQNFEDNYFAVPMAGNGHFALGAVENLTGNNDLISVRNRANFSRPFKKIQTLQSMAELKFRDKESVLIENLDITKQKLLDLEQNKESSNALNLTAEQQETADTFRQEMIQTRKQLRQVRHDLKNDIDQLQSRVKFINIFLMPILVCAFGILVSLIYSRGYARRLVKKLK